MSKQLLVIISFFTVFCQAQNKRVVIIDSLSGGVVKNAEIYTGGKVFFSDETGKFILPVEYEGEKIRIRHKYYKSKNLIYSQSIDTIRLYPSYPLKNYELDTVEIPVIHKKIRQIKIHKRSFLFHYSFSPGQKYFYKFDTMRDFTRVFSICFRMDKYHWQTNGKKGYLSVFSYKNKILLQLYVVHNNNRELLFQKQVIVHAKKDRKICFETGGIYVPREKILVMELRHLGCVPVKNKKYQRCFILIKGEKRKDMYNLKEKRIFFEMQVQ